MESNQFGLFATSTAQIHDAPATGGAVQGVPFIEKITFHLLRYVLFLLGKCYKLWNLMMDFSSWL